MKKCVKFGICADVHHSLTPYADRFLKEFLDTCLAEDVDFVIQLGDFCRPDPTDSPRTKDFSDKDQFMAMYRNFPKAKHNVLGNHDIDENTKEEILSFLGSDHEAYYSFDMNGFHFVVLDCNYAKLPDGTYLPYDGGTYYALGKGIPEEQQPFPVVPDFELQWLKEDLSKTPYPSIIFSHQRLTHQISAIRNYKEVQEVLQNAPKGVLMSWKILTEYGTIILTACPTHGSMMSSKSKMYIRTAERLTLYTLLQSTSFPMLSPLSASFPSTKTEQPLKVQREHMLDPPPKNAMFTARVPTSSSTLTASYPPL